MIISLIGFFSYSFIFIYSSTASSEAVAQSFSLSNELQKQMVFYLVGLLLIYFTSRIPYSKMISFSALLYAINILLLIYVQFFGVIAGGARSWIDLGVTRFQPSETMKICWVLYFASYLRYRKNFRSLHGMMIPLLITCLPIILITRQPDFGTASVFVPTFFLLLYLAGARKRHIFLLISFGILTLIPVYLWFFSDIQKSRIDAFINPEQHQQTAAYQSSFSLLAIGEGYWFGKGIGKGRINQLSKLPESHNDFIFSIIASELGFIGALGLIFCYFLLLFSAFMVANFTREPFGKIAVLGLAIFLGVQVFMNLAVTLAMIPTTGITLPFISSGGSSFLTCCIMVGIIFSISRHHVPVLSREDFVD